MYTCGTYLIVYILQLINLWNHKFALWSYGTIYFLLNGGGLGNL